MAAGVVIGDEGRVGREEEGESEIVVVGLVEGTGDEGEVGDRVGELAGGRVP